MNRQVCTRCVMDTTDPSITFDDEGVCSSCHRAETILASVKMSPEEGERRLAVVASKIKQKAAGQRYDCVLGISGGVDSSYTAYLTHRMGLRPLIIHFDNGWNSEIAVSNIKGIVDTLGYDLETYVINWPEFRDIQRAFIRASVVDIEMVTDHAITAAMFRIARQRGIRHILSGSNHATEHCMPKTWIWNKQDLVNLRAIHRRFGEVPLKTYPMLPTWKYLILRRTFFDYVEPLNNIRYRKLEAMEVLKRELGWRYYGGKHYESTFTKFFQAHILPSKFGVDKRKAHLSALIRNGEISRVQALEELESPLYAPQELARDKEYVLKKLGFAEAEFKRIMDEKPVSHDAYPTDRGQVDTLMNLYMRLKRLGLVKGTR